jgi:hypothetical protein
MNRRTSARLSYRLFVHVFLFPFLPFFRFCFFTLWDSCVLLSSILFVILLKQSNVGWRFGEHT